MKSSSNLCLFKPHLVLTWRSLARGDGLTRGPRTPGSRATSVTGTSTEGFAQRGSRSWGRRLSGSAWVLVCGGGKHRVRPSLLIWCMGSSSCVFLGVLLLAPAVCPAVSRPTLFPAPLYCIRLQGVTRSWRDAKLYVLLRTHRCPIACRFVVLNSALLPPGFAFALQYNVGRESFRTCRSVCCIHIVVEAL